MTATETTTAVPAGLTEAEAFFYREAGFSYDPQTETADQGRLRGARALAAAENRARHAGVTFTWDVDDIDSSSFEPEDDPGDEPYRPYELYFCAAHHDGAVVASLGGIDLGRGTLGPYIQGFRNPREPYVRVVEAELAAEFFHEHDTKRQAAIELAGPDPFGFDVPTVPLVRCGSCGFTVPRGSHP